MRNRMQTDESRQVLERLGRSGLGQTEISVVRSPGSVAQVLTAKVESLSSYNLYNVRAVVLDDVGIEPLELGGQMKAFNLAESFTQQGQLQAGEYIVMCRVGDKNIFYAKP